MSRFGKARPEGSVHLHAGLLLVHEHIAAPWITVALRDLRDNALRKRKRKRKRKRVETYP
jgi:hypothetical protein